MANKLYVNNSNGRKDRATKATFDDATGRSIFQWLSGMVKDGLAETNPDLGNGNFDNLLGIQSGSHAMAFDTSAVLGTVTTILGSGQAPNVEIGVGPFPGPGAGAIKGGVLVSGGSLYMVNKSAPAKQAAAWQFLKYLDSTENMTTWAIDTGYIPIRESSAKSAQMQAYWEANPFYKVAYDQLLNGPTNVATAGSVIGNYTGVRDAVRDAENSMFLNGTDPKAALKSAQTDASAAMDDYNSRLGVG
jgi:sn-glycerol 3-phosphate transport system substrate-binding protein